MKKFYKEHRIFVILMGIVLVCLIVLIILLFRFFYFGSASDARHTCTEISEGTRTDYINGLKEDPTVKDATYRLSDKSDIIYITIKFNDTASLVEAQSKAIASLEGFSEEEKDCYDFQFILSQDATETNEGFTIMGAANANGTNILFNNNNTKVDAGN